MKKHSPPLPLSHKLVPPVIDLAMVLGMLFLTPWLGAQIFAQAFLNHLFLIPGFFLIIAGILAIRSLPDYSLDDKKDPAVLPVLLVFAHVLFYTLFYAYATNIGGSEKGNENVGVVLLLLFLPLVCVAFSWPTTKAEPGEAKALTAQAVGLVSVNYLTLIGASVLGHFVSLPTSEDPVYATGVWFLILFCIFYLLFLVFFGLPRIYLLRATGDKCGLTVYLLGVAVFLWDKIPPVN